MRIWGRYLTVFVSVLMLSGVVLGEPPPDVNYQGKLLDAAGETLTGPVNLIIRIFDQPSDGTQLYAEDHQGVILRDGVFNVLLGTGTNSQGPFDAQLFAGTNRWLEVLVNGEILTPRQPFSSVGYALQSEAAESARFALDADTVDGLDSSALDQSSHVGDVANPHGVTAGQVGAATAADVDTAIAVHSSDASAHHAKTESFAELFDQASDGQIPESLARDDEVVPLVLDADGTGSGIDADLLDGLSSDGFVQDAGDTMSGTLTLNSGVLNSGDYRYTSARTHYFTVSGADYDPRGGAQVDQWSRSPSSGYGFTLGTVNPGQIVLAAPVHVPDGARIEGMQCSFYDDEPNADVELFIRLNRHSLTALSGAQQQIVRIDLPGYTQDDPDIVILTPTSVTSSRAIVDNANFSYGMSVTWNSSGTKENIFGIRWFGCRVEYTVDRVPF